MATQLIWSDELGRHIRGGTWQEQTVSTVTRVTEALRAGRSSEAAGLVDHFVEEARIVQRIYEVWYPRFGEWLLGEGVPAAEVEAELTRLATLLALPDGRPFAPDAGWQAFTHRAHVLSRAIGADEVDEAAALGELDAVREDWRRQHDRWADLLSGVLTFVARRFGEGALEPCYRHVLEPYIDERYMVYDLREREYADTLFRNLYTTAEAMRAHLCGPDRLGDIELEEHADRWEFRFDPCGSGGRALRGDPVEGTGPRPEPPYDFGVTQEAHDWAWNERGVCYYCAHCCFALERLPAERWGHPVRVVNPPLYAGPGAPPQPLKCSWTVYKTVEAIPAAAYERIGLVKPAVEG